MAVDPSKPLLRLNVSEPQQRQPGSLRPLPRPKPFSIDHQRAAFGPKFDRLASVQERDQNGLEIRSDPSALAPERLLVFEVRGSILPFVNTLKNVAGFVELIDVEELESDEHDKKPTVYLLVPDAQALRNIASLRNQWVQGGDLGFRFAPWRDVFATLRDIRPWGPEDRVHAEDRNAIAEDIADLGDGDLTRIEIELVFRSSEARATELERELSNQVDAVGGRIVSRSRIPEIGYHAVLAELLIAEARRVVARSQASIAGLDLVMHIRPQSVATTIDAADAEETAPGEMVTVDRPPILALLDGVPVAQHPLLAGTLSLDDRFALEPLTLVSDRIHGTAMASLIVYGDRNFAPRRLTRRVHVVPVLGSGDAFPSDRLIVDLIYQAVLTMREGDEPSAPDVVVVNLSLGNARKPFHGRMSAFARLLDRLSYRYGILFIVSAGNHAGLFPIPKYTTLRQYEGAPDDHRAEATLLALKQLIPQRRLLSPAESINSVTVGAANVDAVSVADRKMKTATSIDPFPSLTTSNPSSALGPGFANSVKPDVLMHGGKEHLRFVNSGSAISVKPGGPARAHGLKVAAPPKNGVECMEHYTDGTSAAAALTSRTCHLIHDALEETYGEQFVLLSHSQRATLLKALLVHTAAWPAVTAERIKRVLGPVSNRQNVRQKDNIRRFLGYGLADQDAALACTDDRATFWATGTLPREQAVTIKVPVPVCMNGQAKPHALMATLAWFTPVLPGRQIYRAVRLALIDEEKFASLRVKPAKAQPDNNQSNRGTVISRRWEGAKAPVVGEDHFVTLTVQRQPEQGPVIDEPIPFAVAVTLAMPGELRIYEQVRARVEVAPRVAIK